MTPELALQKAIRARLINDANLQVLVPAASILDRNERPAPDPSIIIGEGLSRDEGNSLKRSLVRVFMDLHVWKKEPSTAGVKAIVGEIRNAIRSARLPMDAGFHCVDAKVASARVLRDPDGETSHAVITIETLVEELL